MGNLSAHFDRREFECKCGKCASMMNVGVSTPLIDKLEEMRDYFSKLPTGCAGVVITSGLRCPSHSVSVGGTSTDAHTKGIAADIMVYTADKKFYSPKVICAVAEKLGFGGIGEMISSVHVDMRHLGGYVNNFWHGNEITGDNNCTWKEYLPKIEEVKKTHKITVLYDDNIIFEKEV